MTNGFIKNDKIISMGEKTILRHGQLGILGILVFLTVVQPLLVFITVPDARTRFALIIMSLFVVNPLIIFYLRNGWPRKIISINIAVLLIGWFFTLPLFHELSHLIGVYAIGSKPIAYQILPKFMKGDFTTAWVRSEPINDWRGPIPGLSPYIKDIFLLIIGFFILKWKKVNNAFWAGFIYVFFCLGSLFDIANNFSQKLLGYVKGNDFYGVSLGWGNGWANRIGITFSSFAIFICISVLVSYKSPNIARKYKLWESVK
jgi:hypothetical protein